ncbi:hypothetical protein [Streptomyces agglomeratus]|uniref:hypothetical protein n=1 Tax=Streptomyces agglomeratus TaxID=285458 RepID=UPI0008550B91|nr:hypothetical protein [Streptomyces agglomeratus]OEJ49530.1 hypothetical protein BGK72_00555 [Streptomyces agglomeratus]
MNLTAKLAAATAVCALAIGLAPTPAGAAEPGPAGPPPASEPLAAAWYESTATGAGKVRECYYASCDGRTTTYPGETLWWSHYAYNDYGNRWYYVRLAGASQWVHGWVYCGHVAEGC